MDVTFGPGGMHGCDTRVELLLMPRIGRAALLAPNPLLPADANQAAIEKLSRDSSAMSLAAPNRETHTLIN
jgi:hypothetical protein